MHHFFRAFGRTIVGTPRTCQLVNQSARSIFANHSGARKNTDNSKLNPLNIFEVATHQRHYSTQLRGKFLKGFQKLAKTYDQTVQIKKQLSKLESKWLVRAAQYANKEKYDKEYQALYMMICYFARKKNSLADKVHKANLDNNHTRVLTLLSHLRQEEIPPNLYAEYAQALIHTGQSEEAFNFINRMLENPGIEMEDTLWRQRLYYTKVQLLLERGQVKEAIDVCESHMDHENHLWPLAMGTILTTAEEFKDGSSNDPLECYDTAIDMLTRVPVSVVRAHPHLLKGQLFESTGDIHAAIKEYEYALWIKPNEKRAIERLIGLYSEVGRVDDVQLMQHRIADLNDLPISK